MNSKRLAAAAASLALALPARAAQNLAAPPARSRPAAALAADPDDAGPVWRVGPAFGLELGTGDLKYSAAKVRVDAQRQLRRLSPVSTLSFVASLGIAHASGDESVPVLVDPFFGVVETATLEWDANVFELIPAARLTYAATPRLSFFADGGLGLVYTVANVYAPPAALALGASELVEDGVGGVLRLAGGLAFTPSPSLRIGIEAIGLHVRFGDGPGTAFNLLASVSHRL